MTILLELWGRGMWLALAIAVPLALAVVAAQVLASVVRSFSGFDEVVLGLCLRAVAVALTCWLLGPAWSRELVALAAACFAGGPGAAS